MSKKQKLKPPSPVAGVVKLTIPGRKPGSVLRQRTPKPGHVTRNERMRMPYSNVKKDLGELMSNRLGNKALDYDTKLKYFCCFRLLLYCDEMHDFGDVGNGHLSTIQKSQLSVLKSKEALKDILWYASKLLRKHREPNTPENLNLKFIQFLQNKYNITNIDDDILTKNFILKHYIERESDYFKKKYTDKKDKPGKGRKNSDKDYIAAVYDEVAKNIAKLILQDLGINISNILDTFGCYYKKPFKEMIELTFKAAYNYIIGDKDPLFITIDQEGSTKNTIQLWYDIIELKHIKQCEQEFKDYQSNKTQQVDVVMGDIKKENLIQNVNEAIIQDIDALNSDDSESFEECLSGPVCESQKLKEEEDLAAAESLIKLHKSADIIIENDGILKGNIVLFNTTATDMDPGSSAFMQLRKHIDSLTTTKEHIQQNKDYIKGISPILDYHEAIFFFDIPVIKYIYRKNKPDIKVEFNQIFSRIIDNGSITKLSKTSKECGLITILQEIKPDLINKHWMTFYKTFGDLNQVIQFSNLIYNGDDESKKGKIENPIYSNKDDLPALFMTGDIMCGMISSLFTKNTITEDSNNDLGDRLVLYLTEVEKERVEQYKQLIFASQNSEIDNIQFLSRVANIRDPELFPEAPQPVLGAGIKIRKKAIPNSKNNIFKKIKDKTIKRRTIRGKPKRHKKTKRRTTRDKTKRRIKK